MFSSKSLHQSFKKCEYCPKFCSEPNAEQNLPGSLKFQDTLSWNNKFLLRGNFRDRLRVQIQMRSYRFRRQAPEPIVQ